MLRSPRLLDLTKRFGIAHIKRYIKDPVLQKKLTPDYTPGCKRIIISDDFYPALAMPHVNVVSEGIECITPNGVRSKDGVEHHLDALVCATGFYAAESPAPFPIHGLNGRELNQVWGDAAQGYRGTTVSGFPNFFMIVGPNTGLGHTSMVLMIESQAQYVLGAIQHIRRSGVKYVDVLPEHQERYNADLQKRLAQMVWAKGGCVSWYNTSAGRNTTLWPASTFAFRFMTRRFDVASYKQVTAVPQKRTQDDRQAA